MKAASLALRLVVAFPFLFCIAESVHAQTAFSPQDSYEERFEEWGNSITNAKVRIQTNHPKPVYFTMRKADELETQALASNAHLHVEFLVEQLKSEPLVAEILDKSEILVDAYRPRLRGTWFVGSQSAWLHALTNFTNSSSEDVHLSFEDND